MLLDLFSKIGIKAKEIRFLKPQTTPYVVFFDEQIIRGSDNKKSITIEHDVVIQLYTKEINQDNACDKIESMILDEIETDYKRNRDWIEEDSKFITTYEFKFIEKKRR